ncbi:MAG TPA: hypothetical protein VF109_09540 [Mycobacteriales bacterium]
MGEPVPRHRRRERRRSRLPVGTPGEHAAPVAEPPAEERPAPAAPVAPAEAEVGKVAKARPRRADAERGLRGIVGAGPSQVGTAGAMRARDAARPTAEDLAAAERDLVIVRRHYVPPPD